MKPIGCSLCGQVCPDFLALARHLEREHGKGREMAQAQLKAFEDISRRDFVAYETVRESGVLNMFDPRVCDLAGFDGDTHVSIIHFYTELRTKFPGVRKEA